MDGQGGTLRVQRTQRTTNVARIEWRAQTGMSVENGIEKLFELLVPFLRYRRYIISVYGYFLGGVVEKFTKNCERMIARIHIGGGFWSVLSLGRTPGKLPIFQMNAKKT